MFPDGSVSAVSGSSHYLSKNGNHSGGEQTRSLWSRLFGWLWPAKRAEISQIKELETRLQLIEKDPLFDAQNVDQCNHLLSQLEQRIHQLSEYYSVGPAMTDPALLSESEKSAKFS